MSAPLEEDPGDEPGDLPPADAPPDVAPPVEAAALLIDTAALAAADEPPSEAEVAYLAVKRATSYGMKNTSEAAAMMASTSAAAASMAAAATALAAAAAAALPPPLEYMLYIRPDDSGGKHASGTHCWLGEQHARVFELFPPLEQSLRTLLAQMVVLPVDTIDKAKALNANGVSAPLVLAKLLATELKRHAGHAECLLPQEHSTRAHQRTHKLMDQYHKYRDDKKRRAFELARRLSGLVVDRRNSTSSLLGAGSGDTPNIGVAPFASPTGELDLIPSSAVKS